MQACVCKQDREVEPALWKSVFYRPIEEFRRRIKAAAAAGEKGREPLQKVSLGLVVVSDKERPSVLVCATQEKAAYACINICLMKRRMLAMVLLFAQVKIAFGKFLHDAALFYRQLACKLQSAYGNVGFSLADAKLQTVPSVPAEQYKQQDCTQSVYRCLICLGDIFRQDVILLSTLINLA